jgi:hypothetical protein
MTLISNETALAIELKPVESTQKTRRRRDGRSQLPKLIEGVKFADGIEAVRQDV